MENGLILKHLQQKENFSNFRSDYQKFDKYLQWIYKLKTFKS